MFFFGTFIIALSLSLSLSRFVYVSVFQSITGMVLIICRWPDDLDINLLWKIAKMPTPYLVGCRRESTDENYVPDVFFMQKDEYGNEIKKVRNDCYVTCIGRGLIIIFPMTVRYGKIMQHFQGKKLL